jgi:hypothetical protein
MSITSLKEVAIVKRLLILVLVLLLVGSVVLAEDTGLDLSGKTVDDLIAIRQAVDEALFEQGGKVVLPIGKLIAGKDIATGSYVIEVHGYNAEEVRSYEHFNIVVWKSEQSQSDYQTAYNEYSAKWNQAKRDKDAGKEYEYPVEIDETQYMSFRGAFNAGDSARVTLDDGQVLMCNTDIENATMTIEQAKGLFMD